MKKGKVKEFIKENKTAIICGAIGGMLAAGFGYKYCKYKIAKDDPIVLCDSLKDILYDAESVYGQNKRKALYTQVLDPVEPKDLGKLGKQMIEDAKEYPGKVFKLTHFIACGEFYEK